MSPWITYGLPGVLLLTTAIVLFGQTRPARLPAMFLTLIGILLLLVAVFPGLERAVLPNKIRLFMGVVSLTHLFITLEAVRRNTLKERYALLWIGTGLALLVFAIQPNVIGWLVQVTGMHYTSAIMLVIFSFLILIAFHVSLVLSQYETDRRKLAQKIALLEEQIRRLEDKLQP
ncbi:MAG: DUF2304 domain-containing protein [Verrucomicrobia bacterium]|nr:DUF2304 domain-containing protein [Verrucomicrobiota bacterium]MCH8526428.1 DUF2304 domain-containing protein [Kiritimatiellia bacterium]